MLETTIKKRRTVNYKINIKRVFIAEKRLDDILYALVSLRLKMPIGMEKTSDMCYTTEQAFPTNIGCLKGGYHDSV